MKLKQLKARRKRPKNQGHITGVARQRIARAYTDLQQAHEDMKFDERLSSPTRRLLSLALQIVSEAGHAITDDIERDRRTIQLSGAIIGNAEKETWDRLLRETTRPPGPGETPAGWTAEDEEDRHL
jgi:hypothetical protein